MSLFGMLGNTARALDAQRFGLDVVGHNLANVNTAGYTRRVAQFAAVPPNDRYSAGGGVSVLGVQSQRDRLFDRRLFDELPLEQRASAMTESIGLAEVALGRPGQSLDAALSDMFDAFAELADAPTSVAARQQVVSEASSLVSVFRSLSTRLTDAERSADARVRADVERLNGLTRQLASLNNSIGGSPAGESLQLRDQQIETARAIAGIMSVQILELADGTMQISTESGRPLVIGADAYALTVSDTPPSGYAAISSAGVDITSQLRDGSIGGQLAVRDTLVPGYRAQLDGIAHGVAVAINGLHATGFDASGTPGGAFFVPPVAVAGAAATLTLDPTLAADPSRIAAAGVPVSGDNAVARQLANLRDGAVVGSVSASDAWAGLVYQVGSDLYGASRELDSRREIVMQIETLRDSVSGVSVDEEAAMMMRFQRAYEANARFFSVVDETLQTLLSLKR